ncbi:hypothetical protein N656DRAFT_799165 [Canariomyces notabilis]|uniref:Uncharacterized protein n=1 Tax=Canariomyces notabilis TaxID=2074819 RepID=A0AAN6YQT4_9PEZI|nr:hypothetical protein N656DRAFT_799165 [Canariomyces arenarius]
MADGIDAASWYAWFTEPSFVPSAYHYILRGTFWFFMTISLLLLSPILLLLVIDLVLYFWRLSTVSKPAAHMLQAGHTTGPPKPPARSAQDGSAGIKKLN